MKFCSRCEEEFADKFSFCPVDGTPLTPVSAKVPAAANITPANIADPSLTVSHDNGSYENDESVTRADGVLHVVPAIEPVPHHAHAAAGNGSMAMIPREEYHLTFLSDAGLVSRLSHEVGDVAHEYQLTWPE
ncbi:MAG TPA: hypothetical protein VFT02_08945, partial [Pyrinomonadaceae bacterium]|nr:hypothetical protein [Pyrinomonadaceae bacterium]